MMSLLVVSQVGALLSFSIFIKKIKKAQLNWAFD